MGEVVKLKTAEEKSVPHISESVERGRRSIRDAFFSEGKMLMPTPFGFVEVRIPPTEYRPGNYRRY